MKNAADGKYFFDESVELLLLAAGSGQKPKYGADRISRWRRNAFQKRQHSVSFLVALPKYSR